MLVLKPTVDPRSQVYRANVAEMAEAVGRLPSDAKLHEIGAGTSEIRRMLISRELFRETA